MHPVSAADRVCLLSNMHCKDLPELLMTCILLFSTADRVSASLTLMHTTSTRTLSVSYSPKFLLVFWLPNLRTHKMSVEASLTLFLSLLNRLRLKVLQDAMMKASIFASKHVLSQHAKDQPQDKQKWLGQLQLTQEAINCQIVESRNDRVSIALLQKKRKTIPFGSDSRLCVLYCSAFHCSW